MRDPHDEFTCRECGVECGDSLCDICREFVCRSCGLACGDTLCDICREVQEDLAREEAGVLPRWTRNRMPTRERASEARTRLLRRPGAIQIDDMKLFTELCQFVRDLEKNP